MGDNDALADQERILQDSLPSLLDHYERMREEYTELQRKAAELDDCDQDDLAQTRQQLITANQSIRAKQERLAALKQQSKQLDTSFEDAQDAKIENLQAIQEAQRVREQYRGWSTTEVSKIKGRSSIITRFTLLALTSLQSKSRPSKPDMVGQSRAQQDPT